MADWKDAPRTKKSEETGKTLYLNFGASQRANEPVYTSMDKAERVVNFGQFGELPPESPEEKEKEDNGIWDVFKKRLGFGIPEQGETFLKPAEAQVGRVEEIGLESLSARARQKAIKAGLVKTAKERFK